MADLLRQFGKLFTDTLLRQVRGVKPHSAVYVVSHGLGNRKALCHHHRPDGNACPFVEVRRQDDLFNPVLIPLKKTGIFPKLLQRLFQPCHSMQLFNCAFIRHRAFRQITGYRVSPVSVFYFMYHISPLQNNTLQPCTTAKV